MTLKDSVLTRRLYVIRRAQALGNVSAACREAGTAGPWFGRGEQARADLSGPRGYRPYVVAD